MTRGAAWLLAALILLGSAGFSIHRGTLQHGSGAPLPVLYTLGGDFELDATSGERLSLSDLQGELVLLNFGYTGCPDVCPTALARMREVLNLLGERRTGVRPVFVTLDPEVDGLDRIGPYLNFFDPAFIGLTGTAAEVAVAAAAFKVYYERQPLPSSAGYTISHSSHIYLIDASGRVRATFGEGVPVGKIAESVHTLIERPGDDGTEKEANTWWKA